MTIMMNELLVQMSSSQVDCKLIGILKTEFLFQNQWKIHVESCKLGRVTEYKYLGQTMVRKERLIKEMRIGIENVRSKFCHIDIPSSFSGSEGHEIYKFVFLVSIPKILEKKDEKTL